MGETAQLRATPVLALLLALGASLAPHPYAAYSMGESAARHAPPRAAPPAVRNLDGTWAWEGTGPAGLTPRASRLATITIRRRGHRITGTLTSGAHAYELTGTYYYPRPTLTFKWRTPKAGLVRFSGTLQRDNTHILGQWRDAHDSVGGALLVKVAR